MAKSTKMSKRKGSTPGRRSRVATAPKTLAAAGTETPEKKPIPIVGIGASAGGYEAFVQFLQALPVDTGMAFVLLMHLEPEHKSMLASLLSNKTPMQVYEAHDDMEVRPNHVYVIPPKSDMSIQGGALKITARRKTQSLHLPVDNFFVSLAENRGDRAIGVVLSGTGSDGTVGLKAIKVDGGITFAQDEASAKHHGMPGSAISSGCVDSVLSPEEIALELGRLARHPYVGAATAASLPPVEPVGETTFRKVLFLLRAATGVDFGGYKPGTLRRRIARRMALLKTDDLKIYLSHLKQDRSEVDALFQDILIHVTEFFREPEAFKALQSQVFPRIVAGKKPGEAIRIWVPGCSTGEEVYSLVISLLEVLGDRISSTPIQAFGTDISEPAIEIARIGAYTGNSIRGISTTQLRRYFTKTDFGYRVNKALRESCVFARQDLSKDPPFSRMDLISCRNVLIYMGAALQKRVVTGFHYALRENGFLLLGKSESLTSYSDLFAPAERKASLFTKKPDTMSPTPDFTVSSFGRMSLTMPAAEEQPFDALKEADRLIWQRFSHSGLILNDDLEILHFRGDTNAYVSPASGKASLHALRMVKDELKMELRSVIHRARRTNSTARSTCLRVRHNGGFREVNLEVEPIWRPGGKERYFLILFDESKGVVKEKHAPSQPRPRGEDRELAQLRRELEASREYLQSVVEQQEASNEELKSANEEILSSNEELQSTNEELETAKEELQSGNEELVTLNETLQNRNAELAKLSDDLMNILDCSGIPILIVGDDGLIRRFTPPAAKLLNLRPGDVGRPIDNIRPNIEMPDLRSLFGQAVWSPADVEREVQDNEGRWYFLRVRPYRTADHKVDGALVAFVDIDALKRANRAAVESEAMVSGLEKTLLRAIVVVDPERGIVLVNAAAEKLFKYRREELLGKPLEVLLPERYRADHEQHRAGYFASPRLQMMGEGLEIVGRRKDGSEFPAEVSLSFVQTADKSLAVASLRDMSRDREMEAALAKSAVLLSKSEQQLQALTAGLLTAQEEERERLAGEIHDDLNQRLSTIAMKACALEGELAGSPHATKIREMRKTLEEVSEDMRRLAHQLHPSILEHLGLVEALRHHCEEFSQLRGIRVALRRRNVPERIPEEVSLCMYRVAQEALKNIAKHSGATEGSVYLSGVGDDLRIVVSDNGTGFDADAMTQSAVGIVGMRERARLAGGTFQVKSVPGDGTRIEVCVPLAGKKA